MRMINYSKSRSGRNPQLPFGVTILLLTIANREAAAIRSAGLVGNWALMTIANREAAAIRSETLTMHDPRSTIANREAAAIRSSKFEDVSHSKL